MPHSTAIAASSQLPMSTPDANASADRSGFTIAGLDHSTVLQYFETFNAGAFTTTAALFAVDGELHPPFESPVVGEAAIAAYLEQEANGMHLQPKHAVTNPLEDGNLHIQVTGYVKTPWFGVNLAWNFVLNPAQEIVIVAIKLLASPQELLKLRR